MNSSSVVLGRTLKEWNKKGYLVRKGEKSISRNEKGEAVFLPFQVWKPQHINDFGDYEYEDDDMWAGFHNYGWGDD